MDKKPEQQKKGNWSQLARKHRSIYRFGGPWAQALLAPIPWINALILVVLLLAVHGKLVITPGIAFDLPRAPLREGSNADLTALMIVVARDAPGGEESLIFFDDDRYLANDDDQMEMLSERIKSLMALGRGKELLLLADKRVPHGDVIRFVNVVREAGLQRVSVAEKPE